MATRELDEAQYQELAQAHALLKSLYADQTVGFDFRKIVKKKYPSASIPELDAVVKTEALAGDFEKKFGELGETLSNKIDSFLNERKKERENEDVEKFAGRIKRIVKDRGYTQEGEEGLLKTMKERGISNPEDAAIIFEAGQPKAAPKPRHHTSRMNFVSPEGKDDESFKKLMADPEQWMVDEMYAGLAEAGEAE